jgi:hypothetical protein
MITLREHDSSSSYLMDVEPFAKMKNLPERLNLTFEIQQKSRKEIIWLMMGLNMFSRWSHWEMEP